MTLSKTNKIYLGVVLIFTFVLFLLVPEKTSTHIAKLLGNMLSYIMIPWLLALVVWFLSGMKEKGGNLTFNIVLTLVIIGQFGQFTKKSMQYEQIANVHKVKEEFNKEISVAGSKSERDDAYNRYIDSMESGVKKQYEKSTGDEKQFYSIVIDFSNKTIETQKAWKDAVNVVMSPRILDYSILTTDDEFNYQRNVIMLYIEKTKVSKDYFENLVPNLRERLSVLGDGNENANATIREVSKKHQLQKSVLGPLYQAHIECGTNMIHILDLLHNNKDDWSYENKMLLIEDSQLRIKHNKLVENLNDSKIRINVLADKVAEVM